MTNRVRLVLDRPCTEDARRFEAREGGRWCLHCESMQYDLRDATRSEAVRVLKDNGGRACVRLRLGPGGEPRFVAEAPLRSVGVAAAIAASLAACGSGETASTEAPLEAPPASAAPITAPPVEPPHSEAPAPPVEPPAPASTAPADPTPPPTEIDHSTDASPDAAHHQQHRHRHPPAHAPSGADYDGGMMYDDF